MHLDWWKEEKVLREFNYTQVKLSMSYKCSLSFTYVRCFSVEFISNFSKWKGRFNVDAFAPKKDRSDFQDVNSFKYIPLSQRPFCSFESTSVFEGKINNCCLFFTIKIGQNEQLQSAEVTCQIEIETFIADVKMHWIWSLHFWIKSIYRYIWPAFLTALINGNYSSAISNKIPQQQLFCKRMRSKTEIKRSKHLKQELVGESW